MKNCCFFVGHKDTPAEVYSLLYETVEKHICEYGVTVFYVGKYGNFDYMAGKVVGKLKEVYPGIELYQVLAYLPGKKPREEYASLALPSYYDGTFFPEGQELIPYRFAIPRLNQYMIDYCGYGIGYVAYSLGGAFKTWTYASRQAKKGKIKLTNLFTKA